MRIHADTSQIKKLGRDMVLGAPAVTIAGRKALLVAAEPVRMDAQARVQGWPNGPGKISIRVVPSGRSVYVIATGPGAAAIENKGKGFVRHPTFGHRDRMTAKHSHPAYLAPAFDRYAVVAGMAVEKAVMDAVERAVKGR